MDNREFFLNGMGVLGKLFGKTLEADVLNIYWQAFDKISDSQFAEASVYIRDNFKPTSINPFPAIAHFLEACGSGVEDTARVAVFTVKKASEDHDYWHSVDFEDKTINYVVKRYGGWRIVSSWGEKDWQFNEKGFLESYKSAKRAGLISGHCAGQFEHDNLLNGYEYKEIYKIGCDLKSGKRIGADILPEKQAIGYLNG